MSYKVVIASEFAKQAKRIAKKHIGIKDDIAKLIADLAVNPCLWALNWVMISKKYECQSLEQIKENLDGRD